MKREDWTEAELSPEQLGETSRKLSPDSPFMKDEVERVKLPPAVKKVKLPKHIRKRDHLLILENLLGMNEDKTNE